MKRYVEVITTVLIEAKNERLLKEGTRDMAKAVYLEGACFCVALGGSYSYKSEGRSVVTALPLKSKKKAAR